MAYRRRIVPVLLPSTIFTALLDAALWLWGPEDIGRVLVPLLTGIAYVTLLAFAVQKSTQLTQLTDDVPRLTLRRAFVEERSLVKYLPVGSQHTLGPYEAMVSGSQANWAAGTAVAASETGQYQVLERPLFAYAAFANDASTEAHDVAAHITFTGESMDSPLVIIGRWTEPENADVQEATFRPNGIPQTLDLAFKVRGEAFAWVYNNESRRQAPQTWRLESRRLSPGTYRVEVRLRAGLMDQVHAFELTNPGVDGDLLFRVLEDLRTVNGRGGGVLASI